MLGESNFADQFVVDLGHRDLIRLNAGERMLELRRQGRMVTPDDLKLRAAIAVDQDNPIVDQVLAAFGGAQDEL